ncbi:DUF6049 family protein [Kitasatospora camelliae]|uniref:DUF6049 family protein n=1 Tax=Kitasatospora camelliae TaxID=3156397 RepID=A0AAU8JWB3_9ACTN
MDIRSGLTVGRHAPNGRRRSAAKWAAAVAAAGTVLLTAAPPALAERSGFVTANTDYPATVEIDAVSPAVAGENATVTVTGKVTNAGRSALKSAHVAVRSPNRELSTRSEIGQVAARTSPSSQDGVDLDSPEVELGDLGPGQARDYSIRVSTADLRLKSGGVYELAVDVWGGTADNEREHPLGIARSFLPYNSEPVVKPTQVSVIWPITHAPGLVAQTMPDNDQVSVLRDDSLATELAPGGRLHELVRIGGDLQNLTWVVDPDLLDTVYAMTRPYRVQKPGTGGETAREDNTVPGAGRDAATAWLAQLRTVVARQGDEVVSLPYADPDLASIAHNGSRLPGMDTALRKAVTAGQLTAEGRLSVDVRSDVAWPYLGLLDQATASVAQASGSRVVLVNGASMPESRSMAYTPGAARGIDGQTAVVADTTVSALFQGDLNTPGARSAAEQRFLVETMMITSQEPENQRGLLVMPQRSLTAGTATAIAQSVRAAQTGGWITPVKLDAVAGATADPDANTAVPKDYPRETAGSELTAGALSETMAVQSGLDRLMLILTQPQRVRGPFSAAMVRSMSTGWRDQAAAGAAYRHGVGEYLNNLTSAVRVPAKSVITLPGDNATLLISVKNDLNQAVGNLQLRLTSGQVNRLNVGDPEPVVLDATTSRTFRFPAEAQVNGPVQMTAELWTTGPNAQRYGAPVVFTVEVTSVASGVFYVIGGGVVLMALAGIRFYLQRKKRAAAGEEATDPDAPLAPAEPASDGPAPATADADARSAAQAPAGPASEHPASEPVGAADADPASASGDADRAPGNEKVDH